MGFLSVKAEYNQAARDFPQLAKRLPSATRNVLNRLATEAERETTKTVAREMKLPVRFVRNRYDMQGQAKGRRTTIRRASTSRLSAELEVYMRGLPVFQVAGKEVRRKGGGVKATGGRFYAGAFRTRKGLVLKRRGDAPGKLMMPKIGLRQRLKDEYNDRIITTKGRARFRLMYADEISRQFARMGVRA